jgi:8-oxo-dGTP pyrophosphatase MutT (NUDIX family)
MDGYIAWLRSRVGNDKIQLVFAVACVQRDGAILLQRRGDNGEWGFPGGAVELGETAHDAAVRETREETGIPIAITGLIGVYTGYEHHYPNGDTTQPIVIAFRADPLGPPDVAFSPPAETLEARYIDLDKLPHLFNPQHRDLLADLTAGRAGVYR